MCVDSLLATEGNMKTYQFRFNAQLAEFNSNGTVATVYGGSETYLGAEVKECTWAEAQAYLRVFAENVVAAKCQSATCSVALANRKDRAPAGYKDARRFVSVEYIGGAI